jgi:3-oxoacyl-[acyl-carrier-protein] synthase II
MRRVVVTGLGMVTPLGCGVEATWRRLCAGESGAALVDAFEVSDLACRIACSIPRGDGSDGTFNPDAFMEPKEQRKVDPVHRVRDGGRQAALDDPAGADLAQDQCETGVLIGSGIGGIGRHLRRLRDALEKGPRRISPFFIPGASSISRRATCRSRQG